MFLRSTDVTLCTHSPVLSITESSSTGGRHHRACTLANRHLDSFQFVSTTHAAAKSILIRGFLLDVWVYSTCYCFVGQRVSSIQQAFPENLLCVGPCARGEGPQPGRGSWALKARSRHSMSDAWDPGLCACHHVPSSQQLCGVLNGTPVFRGGHQGQNDKATCPKPVQTRGDAKPCSFLCPA